MFDWIPFFSELYLLYRSIGLWVSSYDQRSVQHLQVGMHQWTLDLFLANLLLAPPFSVVPDASPVKKGVNSLYYRDTLDKGEPVRSLSSNLYSRQ
jgi:hypothetical protein